MDDLRSPRERAVEPSGDLLFSSALTLKTTLVSGCRVNTVTLGFTVTVHDHSHTHPVRAIKQISDATVSQRIVAILSQLARITVHPCHKLVVFLVWFRRTDLHRPGTLSNQALSHHICLRANVFTAESVQQKHAGSLPRRRGAVVAASDIP